MRKRSFLQWFLLLTVSIAVSTACEEETPITVTPLPTPVTPPPPPPVSPAPQNTPRIWAHANVDIGVELPINFAILSGHDYGTYNIPATDLSYKWRKISGPASFLIENPDSLKTKVSNLEKGVYQFELEVSAVRLGMAAKDVMNLYVEAASSSNKQIFFRKIGWVCPLGCTLSVVEDLWAYMAPNTPFNVYIKREFSSTWELVKPISQYPGPNYFYEVYPGGSMVVVEEPDPAVDDHPDVKIVF